MEIFAFTHVAANYEAPGNAPRLREFSLEVPTSAAVTGVAGSVAALSVVVSAPDAHALIQRGDVCAEVGTIQRALLDLNYAPGGVDNVFGPTTESAVRSYQGSRGLLVDGVVGPTTAANLGVASSCSADSAGDGDGAGTGGSSPATVNASVLNVRTGPSTDNAIITTLTRGTSVAVVTAGNGWTLVRFGDTEGWVSAAYLTGDDNVSDGSDAAPSAAGTYTISTSSGGGVNVRSTPDGAIAYGLADGTTVSATTTRQMAGDYTWAQLADGNWVATAFLTSGGSTGGGSTGGGTTGTYTVSTSSGGGVNVRTSPNGTRAYGLAEGTSVSVTAARQTVGGFTWAQLADGNWVATAFLSSGGSTGGGSTGGGGAGTYTVDTTSNSGVNVRSSPNGAIAYGLAEGASVSVTTARRAVGGFTWAQLADGNWVATTFLR